MTTRRWRVALALGAVVGAACGKSGKDDSAKPKVVADALKLVDLGQCEAAGTKLREFTSSTPDSFDGFVALGDALTCLCYDPAAKIPRGQAQPERCKEALAAYESALVLRKDAAALVSAGALSLVLGDRDTAIAHLEAAASSGPGAANLLALALLARGDDEARTALDRHYGKRTPSATKPPAMEELCGSGLQCGSVVVVDRVAPRADLVFDVGTVIEDVSLDGAEVVFIDRLHPDAVDGSGYVIKKMPDEYRRFAGWTNPDVTTGVVVESRIPDLPAEPTQNGMSIFDSSNPEHARIRALRMEWHFYQGTGHEVLQRSNDRAGLERKLGVVQDVVPGSVVVAGEDVRIDPQYDRGGAFATGKLLGYAFELAPVRYKRHVFAERRLPVASIAVVRTPEPARIARLASLGADEKRAALAGQLWKGAPLFVAMTARGQELDRVALSLRSGRVTVRLATGEQAETFVEGECVAPVNQPVAVDDDLEMEGVE